MENGIVNVANRMPQDLMRVSVCALDSTETFSQRISSADAEYYLIPKRGEGIDWTLISRLAKVIRNSRADVVHSHNWGTFLYAVLAAKLAGVPIIHGEHGKTEADLRPEGAIKSRVKSALGKRVDCLTTVSQALAIEWKEYGVSPEKIRWIPNGVDTDRFRPRTDQREQRQKFGLPEDAKLLGSIGRLDRLKNYEVLIDVLPKLAAEYPAIHLALLGNGPCRQRLEDKATQLGIGNRVTVLGWHSNPEDFLTAIDIFVLPSKYEGMSNVVLEAMAAGLPIVCADLPGHHEVFVPDVEGIIVSPCAAENLGGTLDALLRDENRTTALRRSAREKSCTTFSITKMVANYQRLYTDFKPD
jgi:glycosyltransferase involved in cell wall biosynthesis